MPRTRRIPTGTHESRGRGRDDHVDRAGDDLDVDRRLADDLAVSLDGEGAAGGDRDGTLGREVADVRVAPVLAPEDVPGDLEVVGQGPRTDHADVEAAV